MAELRKTPGCVIGTEHGSWYALESYGHVDWLLEGRSEWFDFRAYTYEGHEFQIQIRRSAILSVSEVTEERFAFEAQSFFEERARTATSHTIQQQFAQMASTFARRLNDEP